MGGLAELREEARIHPAFTVVDLPFWGPIALESRDRWGWKLIYDCMDEHGGFVEPDDEAAEQRRRLIEIQERALLGGSDLVLAASRCCTRRSARRHSTCSARPTRLTTSTFPVPPAAPCRPACPGR